MAEVAQYHIKPQERLAFIELDRAANPPAPMLVYLTFDTRNGSLDIQYQHNHDSGVIPAVYHGFIRRWKIACTTDADGFAKAINDGEICELLARIQAGATSHYDGNNYDCRLTDDAEEASDEVQEWVDDQADTLSESGGLWDTADWLPDGVHTLPPGSLTASSTDADLSALANRLETEAAQDDVVLYHTEECLRRLRDRLQGTEE